MADGVGDRLLDDAERRQVDVGGQRVPAAEYRRGLIRVSLTAAPRRGRLLAAKAVVIGAVGFIAGLVAATLALAVGTPALRRTGIPIWPVSLFTEARMVVGTAALLALAAVPALAIGTILRRSAPAITAVIVVIFVPYLLSTGPQQGGRSGLGGVLLRITPVAALSAQQAIPKFPQVVAMYRLSDGYYPLAPWAGLAVQCAWAAAALTLAYCLLRRRDVRPARPGSPCTPSGPSFAPWRDRPGCSRVSSR